MVPASTAAQRDEVPLDVGIQAYEQSSAWADILEGV
jgi:hypothetical protein